MFPLPLKNIFGWGGHTLRGKEAQMCSFAQRSEMQAKNRIHKKTKKKAQLGIEQGQKACVTASARVWYLEPKWLRYMLPASM